MEKIHSGKRVLKNTVLLYCRMVLLMGVSLFTSRVVLKTLGVNDFGLYSVVGGIVIILSFLNTSMAGATQRFLNVEMGKGDFEQLKLVFNTARVLHLIIASIVLVLAETVGVWFVNNCLTIDSNRIVAANWVFQFSIITFLVSVISVPYNAEIIAHEKMSAFAYISVIEAVLKLLIVYLLVLFPFDKLIVYSCLLACVGLLIRLIYSIYCHRHFKECGSFSLHYDCDVLKKMTSFSGWTMFGALGGVSHTQGVAVIINLFFGVAVNAAHGVASQVINVINHFVTSFMTALRPQIIKTYAAGDLDSMHLLIKQGSRIGICLISVFAVPLVVEADFVLNIWLDKVPDYTVIFVQLILLTSICNAYAQPLATANAAVGRIRNYQIVLTSLGWLHLPFAWFFFWIGCAPYSAMCVYFVLVNIMQACRIYLVCHQVKMPILEYLSDAIKPCIYMLLLSFGVTFSCHLFCSSNIYFSVLTIGVGVISVIALSFLLVATHSERTKLLLFIRSKLK